MILKFAKLSLHVTLCNNGFEIREISEIFSTFPYLSHFVRIILKFVKLYLLFTLRNNDFEVLENFTIYHTL